MFELLTGSLWLHSPYSTSRMISSTYSHSHGLGSPPNYVSFVWHRLLWDTTSETHNFRCYVLQSLLLMDAHYLTENNLPNSNRTFFFRPIALIVVPRRGKRVGAAHKGSIKVLFTQHLPIFASDASSTIRSTIVAVVVGPLFLYAGFVLSEKCLR